LENRQWYYVMEGKQEGPITEHKLAQMLTSVILPADALVWTQTLESWVPAASLGERLASVSTPVVLPGIPAFAGAAPASSEDVVYAGFWIRVAAALIDGFILMLAGLAVGAVVRELYGAFTGMADGASVIGTIIGVLMRWVYFAAMESSEQQATLGKLAVGIKVTDLDGNRLNFMRASGRHFAKILSSLSLGVGYLMVAFTERKQGLHDMVAGCLVVTSCSGR